MKKQKEPICWLVCYEGQENPTMEFMCFSYSQALAELEEQQLLYPERKYWIETRDVS